LTVAVIASIMHRSYDIIGVDYARLRQPDPRIAAQIEAALGPATTILNVGAGAGSYEPAGRHITAVEPSAEMIRQRRTPAAAVIEGRAEALPFEDGSFDAAMAILTVHHWSDKAAGCREMRRVTRGPIVMLTYDATVRGFWLADYLPQLAALDDAQMPEMIDYAEWLGTVDVHTVPVPHDCSDGFLCAYWQRPAAYLDPRFRAAISSFWAIGDASAGLARLAADLENGAWAQRYGDLLADEARDFGYRLVVTR
jgi:SAM-dependent methyltransferase